MLDDELLDNADARIRLSASLTNINCNSGSSESERVRGGDDEGSAGAAEEAAEALAAAWASTPEREGSNRSLTAKLPLIPLHTYTDTTHRIHIYTRR